MLWIFMGTPSFLQVLVGCPSFRAVIRYFS
jgi:hypothetical protein